MGGGKKEKPTATAASLKEVTRKAASQRYRKTAAGLNLKQQKNEKVKLAMLAVGAVLAVALIMDLSGVADKQQSGADALQQEISQIEQALDGMRTSFADGFSLVIPPGWENQTDQHKGYTLFLKSPNDPDLAILVSEVDDDSFPTLMAKIDRVDLEIGLRMEHQITDFNGNKAIQREASLAGRRVLTIDFARAGKSHHLQYSAHPSVFEAFRPIMEKVLATYEPLIDEER